MFAEVPEMSEPADQDGKSKNSAENPPVPSGGLETKGSKDGNKKISAGLPLQDWLIRHKHRRRTITVVFVCIAGVWALVLQTRLIWNWPNPEPTRTVSSPVRAEPRPDSSPAKPAGSQRTDSSPSDL